MVWKQIDKMLAISNCSEMTSRLLQLNLFPTHRALIELSSYYWEPRKARKILLWSEIKAKFRQKFSTSKSACNPTILEFLQIFTPSKPFNDNKFASKALEVFEVNLLLALYRQISVLFSRKNKSYGKPSQARFIPVDFIRRPHFSQIIKELHKQRKPILSK